MPCSQTKPTQSPGGGAPESVSPTGSAVPTSAGEGGAGASTVATVPTSSPGGATPSQGPGGSTSQPTTPSAGGGAEGQDTFINRTKLILKYQSVTLHFSDATQSARYELLF